MCILYKVIGTTSGVSSTNLALITIFEFRELRNSVVTRFYYFFHYSKPNQQYIGR